MHKEVKAQKGLRETRYASINKRIRSLEELTFIDKVGIKKTKAGFRAYIYELTARAYLAILLDSINMEELIMGMDEATASAVLGDILRALT